MKHIIPVLAIFIAFPHFVLSAQTAGGSAAGDDAAVQVQTANQNGQTRTSGQSGQSQISQRMVPLVYGGGSARSGTPIYSERLQNIVSRYPATGEKPLVVRSSEMNAKNEASLEEDLAVMAHILDKVLDDLPGSQAHARTAMGIDVFVTPNSGPMRSIYLEGYGAIFLLNVGFPVLAPVSVPQEEKPTRGSAWEEARQELYGQTIEPQTVTAPGEEFSEEKVNRLKEALLRALKNATNIRGFEGDITVCVLGAANLVPANTASTYRQDGPHGETATQVLMSSSEAAPLHGTVLTVKVTKADVDAFAKGDLKFPDFQARARIAAYTTTASGSRAMAIGRFGGGGIGLKR